MGLYDNTRNSDKSIRSDIIMALNMVEILTVKGDSREIIYDKYYFL